MNTSNVISIFSRRPVEPNREAQALRALDELLPNLVSSPTIRMQAKARVIRSLNTGLTLTEAVHRACSWVVCAEK